MANVIAYFTSGAINRVTLSMAGDGTVDYKSTWVSDPTQRDMKAANKQRLATLGMLVLAYLNSPVVEVKHVAVDPQLTVVNTRRERKGKRSCRTRHITSPASAKSMRQVRKARLSGQVGTSRTCFR